MMGMGRHLNAMRGGGGGHSNVLIAQGWKGYMDKPSRSQCNRLVCFNVERKECEDLSSEWNCPPLANAHLLKKFEYIRMDRLGDPVGGRVEIPR